MIRKTILQVLALLLFGFGFSQNGMWTEKAEHAINEEDIINYSTEVSSYDVYELDEDAFKNTLSNAPLRFQENDSDVLLEMPYSQGKFGLFEIFETQTLHPQLASNYPGIKSYVGKSRGANGDRLRLTVTPHGIYGKIFSPKGSVYINPYTKNGGYFKVFYMADASFPPLVCHFEEQLEGQAEQMSPLNNYETMVDDSTFRLYQFAGSATGEYSTFHVNQAGVGNGSDAQKKAAVLAAMTVSLDRVNGITENELAVTFQFFPQTDLFIYLDPATDPFTNQTNTGVTASENQAVTASASNSFDLGHVFSTAPGGVALVLISGGQSIGNICIDNAGNNPNFDNIKAAATTGNNNNPIGDGFDLILAHEMGHQMAATHTQNNSCQRSDISAYETGSGVTIMSYAGICSPNVLSDPFDHYHAFSLTQMFNRISNLNCAQTTNISNGVPVINSLSNYTIPRQTPFMLDVQATDPDGDLLTYNWEQLDNEITQQPPLPGSSGGPNFRGFNVTTASSRVFPRIETVLNNQNQTTWEVLPNVARTMDFVVTVRDNNILGGQNEQDQLTLTIDSSGPFQVTSQNAPGIVWTAGTTETITWNVNGTDAPPVNATNVDIILSTNGGISFDHVLASATPNDGSHDVVVPFDVVGGNCRLMVKGTGNVFFDVNQEEFNVNATCESNANGTSVNIPDGAGFFDPLPGVPGESVISISETGIVEFVNLQIDVSHPRLQELEIELESPDGTIVKLLNAEICNTEGINAVFDDGGIPLPFLGCDDEVVGVYRPIESLANFNGDNLNGDWTLRATDFFSGTVGTIESWSIEVCKATTIGTTTFGENSFTLFPNPANNIVNIALADVAGSQSLEIYDLTGRLVQTTALEASTGIQEISIDQLNQGIYLVKVIQNGTGFVEKLIIK